ncbi:hypothetical protein SDC9_157664 [bioreactor metagenome]|uniref:Uncharacterized protein n=1 Tax=bioreactor metagenome TaxID=1076179 RepID=A0A645FAL0_9ZZZZ
MKAPLCETVYLVTANFTTVYFVMQDSRCTKARPKKRRPEQSFVQNYLFQFFFCLCLQDGFAFLFLFGIQVGIDYAADHCADTEADRQVAREVAD